ncbi:hypothetical protein, partial [Clostridium botulinum]|uniref:hypothetical protein n=1 Tax=Clostridium botulinum TaxID=1491 RepID=UPI00217D6D2C
PQHTFTNECPKDASNNVTGPTPRLTGAHDSTCKSTNRRANNHYPEPMHAVIPFLAAVFELPHFSKHSQS